MANTAPYQQVSELMRLLWKLNCGAIITLAVIAHPLLTLYGEKQLEAGHQLLLILLLGQLFLPARILASSIIKLNGNPLHNLYVLLAATSITLIVAWCLKDRYGIIGVATAFSFGFILGALCRVAIIVKTMRVPVAVLLGTHNKPSSIR
ncbi:hypothetical protein [Pseudoalteromonas arctica]|uniref:Polysaccharide biosynthesis protein C-terminal domain-containing protein n=1 Tax=Pseudoalteromonas arctica TaxID=394751 RepID=A0A7Y0DSV3_9GAMM|nr:hypothetical protein [Pseudoalteromonas arctica]NMM40993.1 hypothetical protein [Pseudoalteromonas arctica]